MTAPAQSLLAWVGGALWCVLALVWLRGLGPLTKVHWMHRLHALAPVACLAGLVMLTPGTALRELLGDWLFTGLFVLALLTPVWLWTVRRRNSSVMDVVYSLAALVPAGLEAVRQPALSPANWLMLSLMLVWSTRLVRHASGTNLGARGEQQPYASWRVQFGRRWWWWRRYGCSPGDRGGTAAPPPPTPSSGLGVLPPTAGPGCACSSGERGELGVGSVAA